MDNNSWLPSLTLSNCIVGVAILAMPYCFQQCGILLAAVVIISMSMITRFSCYLILKSASIVKRKTYESIAFEAFGTGGQFCIELIMIGYLFATSVAFFVVTGDLASPLMAVYLDLPNSSSIRTLVVVLLGVCITLPLTLRRKPQSLAFVASASLCFYLLLLVYILMLSSKSFLRRLVLNIADVHLWRVSGLMKSAPIFSMALTCQPQLFEVYHSTTQTDIHSMNRVVFAAINLCVSLYSLIGVAGYLLFSDRQLDGNILASLEPSLFVLCLQIGFVLSIVVGLPLILLPCVTSIDSMLNHSGMSRAGSLNNSARVEEAILLSSPGDSPVQLVSSSSSSGGVFAIPSRRFAVITVSIFSLSLYTSICFTDIEQVLAFIGSTLGVILCYVMPSVIFIRLSRPGNVIRLDCADSNEWQQDGSFRISAKHETVERIACKALLLFGILLAVCGSFANFHSTSDLPVDPPARPPTVEWMPNTPSTSTLASSSSTKEAYVAPVDILIGNATVNVKADTNEIKSQSPVDDVVMKKVSDVPDKSNIVHPTVAPKMTPESAEVDTEASLDTTLPPPLSTTEEQLSKTDTSL